MEALAFETVPVIADGTVVLYDIYVVQDGKRAWLGSRRTEAQCAEDCAYYRKVLEKAKT